MTVPLIQRETATDLCPSASQGFHLSWSAKAINGLNIHLCLVQHDVRCCEEQSMIRTQSSHLEMLPVTLKDWLSCHIPNSPSSKGPGSCPSTCSMCCFSGDLEGCCSCPGGSSLYKHTGVGWFGRKSLKAFLSCLWFTCGEVRLRRSQGSG